jgi:di/tricarboxylate transporter
LFAAAVGAVGLLLWHHHAALGARAALALGLFAVATAAWVVLEVDDTAVALATALAMVATGLVPARVLYDALGHELVWLVLSGFLLAAVLEQTGVSQSLVLRGLGQPRHLLALMRRITLLVALTALLIPSTSARAVLLLPAFLVVARALPGPRQVRAVALLFPSVILLSAGGSLTGAGAHLVVLDMLGRLGHRQPDYLGWLWIAAPMSLLACMLACELMARLFLSRAERKEPVDLPARSPAPWAAAQVRVALLTLATLVGFATTAWHGADPAVVALASAVLATSPGFSGADLRTALKRVEWSLLLFMAATLAMGHAMLDSGAAKLLGHWAVGLLPTGTPRVGIVAMAAALAVWSHLFVTSRTARATVLLPTVVLPLAATGVDAALLAFVAVLGSGFCHSFASSAKPLAVFAQAGVPTFAAQDLLRMSLWLGPVVWALLLFFALVVWPWQGLSWAR